MADHVKAKGGVFLEAPVSGKDEGNDVIGTVGSLRVALRWFKFCFADLTCRRLAFCGSTETGSKAPAEQGTLIFMAAGEKALYEQVAEDLDAMGKVCMHGRKRERERTRRCWLRAWARACSEGPLGIGRPAVAADAW